MGIISAFSVWSSTAAAAILVLPIGSDGIRTVMINLQPRDQKSDFWKFFLWEGSKCEN